MSLFGKILEQIGFKSPVEAAAAPQAPSVPIQNPDAVPPPAPEVIAVVDVVAQLEKLTASNPEKLNRKVSIVNLLQLLGLGNSNKAAHLCPMSLLDL